MEGAASDSLDAVGVVDRAELPDSVRARLQRFDELRGQRWRVKARPEGFRMDFPELELSYFPSGYGSAGYALVPLLILLEFVPVFLMLPYLAGLGLVLYNVFSLRSSEVSMTRWGVAAALVVVGSLLTLFLERATVHLGPLNRHGLCLLPEGLLRIREGGVQFVPRARIAALELQGQRLYAVLREPAANWSLVAGGSAAARQQVLEAWLGGTLSYPEAAPPAKARPKRALIALFVPVPMAAFFWVTLVHPTRSAQGQAAIAFFSALGERRVDDAYALLSERAQSRVPRARFEASLPAGYLGARGASINAISTGFGTAVGAEACVDGWATAPSGDSLRFAFELSSTENGWRIDDFDREHSCSRP